MANISFSTTGVISSSPHAVEVQRRPAGATSLTILYSIEETAKEISLNRFPYLESRLKSIPDLNKTQLAMKDMFLWSESLPDKCRNKKIKN